MPWLNKRWISVFAFSAAAFVAIISVVGWVNFNDAIKLQSISDSYGTIPDGDSSNNYATNWTQANNVLVCVVTVSSFDPNSKTGPAIGVNLNYNPTNNLISENRTDAPNVGVQVVVQETTSNFQANTPFPLQNLNLIAIGNPNSYPFDTYTGYIQITAVVQQTGDSIPITMYSQGAVQGFDYQSQFQGALDDGSDVILTYVFRRSNTTRLFSAIIFILMWLLSLSIFTAAMSVWFREKNAELPLIAISTALLFALPNVRNSQPGVPSIVGTTEDMVGFFWNLLIVGISAISLLVKYILQNKRPTPTLVTPPSDLENGKKPTALNYR